MEIITLIKPILKYIPILCFLASMSFFSELEKGIKKVTKNNVFKANKIKLLCFAVIIVVLFVVDLQFSEKKIAWKGILAGFVFIGFLGLFSILFKGIGKIFIFKTMRGYKIIRSVTSSGFVIQFDKGRISYDWNEIKSLTLNDMKLSVEFFSKKRKLIIDATYVNYYYLLKNIPKIYPTIDYNFLEDFFNSLTTCQFCGLVAFHKDYCLACRCDDWNEELAKEYPNKEEYIRENQLEIFATMDKHEAFSNFKMDCKPFVHDEKWKPMVTKQEVLEYSKKEFWDED